MYTFVNSNISHIQNYVVSLKDFLGTTKKYAKIISVALVVLIALAAFVSVYRYRAKKLALNQTPVPPPAANQTPVPPPPAANQNSSFPENKEQYTQILKKTQEIAQLPISDDFDFSANNLSYHSEKKIKEEKNGILLTDNKNPLDQSENAFYVGIVALPVDGGYCLHLCPGGGNMKFSEHHIDEYMEEAIKELVKQDITITSITGNIGRHPGDTMENFKKWQARHSV